MMIASQTSQTPLFHRSECSHMQLINSGDKTLCHIGNSAFIPHDFIPLTLTFMMNVIFPFPFFPFNSFVTFTFTRILFSLLNMKTDLEFLKKYIFGLHIWIKAKASMAMLSLLSHIWWIVSASAHALSSFTLTTPTA